MIEFSICYGFFATWNFVKSLWITQIQLEFCHISLCSCRQSVRGNIGVTTMYSQKWKSCGPLFAFSMHAVIYHFVPIYIILFDCLEACLITSVRNIFVSFTERSYEWSFQYLFTVLHYCWHITMYLYKWLKIRQKKKGE